jgi:bifunctional ADP-heptose synthase (sugar kinase/adenylyltransferase)
MLLSDNLINKVINIVQNNSYEYIVISDYNKGLITSRLVTMLKSLNVKILVDSKPKNVELFVDTFLVKPNFKEFCEMI